MVACFDRLVRSLTVQAEVTKRVEEAEGRIIALDVGDISSATAAMWLSSSILGLVAEYHWRTTGERTSYAKQAAIVAARFDARAEADVPEINRISEHRLDAVMGAADPAVLRAQSGSR